MFSGIPISVALDSRVLNVQIGKICVPMRSVKHNAFTREDESHWEGLAVTYGVHMERNLLLTLLLGKKELIIVLLNDFQLLYTYVIV